MGRKVLLAFVCWLTLSQTFGDKRSHSFSAVDNESAPRLYRNVPHAVYASAVPYAAYSFHLPTFIPAPKAAASQTSPVKENFVNHLTDSYGNKYVGTPQLSTYKLAFPPQFVPLQAKLPPHLAQPLVAASANFQFKQSNGQYFGVPYRVPVAQAPAPAQLNQFPTFGQLYGNSVKNLAPTAVVHNPVFGAPNTHQQPISNKPVFSNTQTHEQFNNFKQEEKKEPQIVIGKPKVQSIQQIHIRHEPHGDSTYQKIQEIPQSHEEPKFQIIQETTHTNTGDQKFQRIEESPHLHHTEPNSKQITSKPSPGDAKYQQVPELNYESKFQIIQERPHSSQYQTNQEHQASHEEVKFQREHEAPPTSHKHSYEDSHDKPQRVPQFHQSNKAKLQSVPGKQRITYINDINGEKTIVELDTKPKLPLLDLTLLEPLTFDNPLVPQVQHFLPRINQATYQKLPELSKNYQKDYVAQKSSSYDSGYEKSHQNASKKKHKKPTQSNKYPKKNDVPKKPTVTYHETLDDAPEITYEINSPNYKETIKEKSVSYNMKTLSEPVHYTYGSKSEKEPVTYTYTHMSNEPVQIKTVQYEGNGPSPILYHIKAKEQAQEEKSHSPAPHHSEAENDKESSHESDDNGQVYHQHHHHTEEYKDHPKSAEEHHEPVHHEKVNYHKQNEASPHTVVHNSPPKYYSEPAHFTSENINFQPILKEYENNIRLLTTPSASIKVDPHQHTHQQKPTQQPLVHHRQEQPEHHHPPHSSLAPQKPPQSAPAPHIHQQQQHPIPHSVSYNGPAPHIHEKSKRVIIQQEAPDERHTLKEQMQEEVVDQEENSEEDFEKSYQDAAIGFPAYNQKTSDPEKEIFDPDSYGVPRDHIEYDFENTPFLQYQADGDHFPKETRSRYKDARDKMKQNYYTDFSISKPEGLLDRYQHKLGYYKMFKEQKPQYLVGFEDDHNNQKSAKFTVAPSFDFHSQQDKGKSYYGHLNPKQQLYEYDYAKGIPRDNSAFASRPLQAYKIRTNFVEPQFQYGFEPLSIPKLLDSELAAMASNDSPESEKPGMRKKVYKENFYIKKTSTSAGAPAS